jgi:hypothetical protein
MSLKSFSGCVQNDFGDYSTLAASRAPKPGNGLSKPKGSKGPQLTGLLLWILNGLHREKDRFGLDCFVGGLDCRYGLSLLSES